MYILQSNKNRYVSILIAFLCIWLPSLSYSVDFVAGKDYEILPESARSFNPLSSPTDPKSKSAISVVEFFSYGCSWCFHIEPYLTQWTKKQGPGIDFVRVPVVFRPEWKLYAKAYYALKRCEMEPSIHPLLFKNIQEKTLPLNQQEVMTQFFIDHHCDPTIVKSIFDDPASFNAELSEGMAAMAALKIHSVPTIVVNNQYKTNLSMAQNENRLLDVLDYLVRISQAHP